MATDSAQSSFCRMRLKHLTRGKSFVTEGRMFHLFIYYLIQLLQLFISHIFILFLCQLLLAMLTISTVFYKLRLICYLCVY